MIMDDGWWIGEEQLNAEQRAIIALRLEGNYLILGPPGSGKTNLLLLRANYLSLAGLKDILILVFTRTLRRFIASGGREYSFPSDKIQTSRRWAGQLLYEYGVKCDPPADFQGQRKYFIEKIDQLIRDQHLENIYDAILLDESQDYLPAEIMIFNKLARNVFAVADSRQKIYAGEDPISVIRGIADEELALRFHYRNGINICKVADALGKDSEAYEPLVKTCNYNEKANPSSVEHFSCDGIETETKTMLNRLEIQLKAYPNETLGVVCPTHDSLEAVWRDIAATSIEPLAALQTSDDEIAEVDKRIFVCTLHAAKGLEFRALHMVGCEFLKKFPHQRNLAFTAVTRAKTSLSLYYSGGIPGYLEKALQVLEPLKDLPKIRDTFKGTKKC